MRSQPRCDPGAALPDVGSQDRHQSQPCIHQSHQNGFRLDTEKKTLVASEQDEAEHAAWREQAKELPTQDLVIVDETGSRINMTPPYAYASKGVRAVGKIPRNYGANLTLIASLSLSGMGEALLLDGSADAPANADLHRADPI